ncbi:MAG: outer membrane beta-barrel protein [Candidatus Omnitrophica bacterium]|nr:outer membrane beta-barrel protein [Candidatus Omnitrophota bacterium]
MILQQDKKRFWLLIFLVVFGGVGVNPKKSWAADFLDAAAGVDQSFAIGQKQKQFGQAFHQREAYGLPKEAEGPAGEWQMTKKMIVRAAYDGNLFSEYNDPKEDFIHTYTPSLSWMRRGEFTQVTSKLDASYARYVTNHKQSGLSTNHNLNMSYKKNRLSASLVNVFKPRSKFAVGDRGELRSPGKEQVLTWTDNATATLVYKISPKTKASFKFDYSLFFFPVAGNSVATNAQSTQTYSWGPKFTYALTPKLDVYTAYEWEEVNYFQGGNTPSGSEKVSLGADGKLTPKTGLSVDLAYANREYRDKTRPGVDGLYLKTGISRKLSGKLTSSFSYTTDVAEDFNTQAGQEGQSSSDTYQASITWAISPRLSLDGSTSYLIRSKKGIIEMADLENATLKHQREQEDTVFECGTSLTWTPRSYMNFVIGYKFLNKNSTFKNFEYDNHRIAITGEMEF